MLSAAIYARISDDRTGEGLGVARQIADCQAEADRRGWTVGEVYVDDDISAFSGKVRPAYRRMLDDLGEGVRDSVIVWHLDRLHRRPIELEEFAQVCERVGAKVATLHGDLDLGTGDGLLVARIMAAVASNESAAKSRRVLRKMDENAKAGRPHGGSRPFGYEADKVTICPAEAAVIEQLAARFLAGEALNSLAGWINEQGVPTPGGATHWRPNAVRTILKSGRISGRREHRGEIVADATWPAIISPADNDRIRAILADPVRKTTRPARRYALAGMLRCGLCGTKLRGQPKDGKRAYVCPSSSDGHGCGGIRIAQNPVEHLITEAVLIRLDTPELAAALQGRQREDGEAAIVAERIRADEDQLEELAGIYAAREISAKEWVAARNPIEARLKADRRMVTYLTQTGDLGRYLGQGDSLRQRWDTLNLDQQRAVIKTVLDHAVIERTEVRGGFDPARVRPLWLL